MIFIALFLSLSFFLKEIENNKVAFFIIYISLSLLFPGLCKIQFLSYVKLFAFRDPLAV